MLPTVGVGRAQAGCLQELYTCSQSCHLGTSGLYLNFLLLIRAGKANEGRTKVLTSCQDSGTFAKCLGQFFNLLVKAHW